MEPLFLWDAILKGYSSLSKYYIVYFRSAKVSQRLTMMYFRKPLVFFLFFSPHCMCADIMATVVVKLWVAPWVDAGCM